jgi:hypothetical protein
MAANLTNASPQRWSVLRKLPWIAAVVILLLPAVAMRFNVEGVAWTASDFVVMGAILLIACGSFEVLARSAPNFAYLAAAATGIGTGFLMVWANLAVGIVGDDLNGANAMFFGVVLVAIVATLFARFRAPAMARAMFATAGALVLAIAIALGAFGATAPEAGLSMVFVAGWLVAGALFKLSAQQRGVVAVR